MRHAPGDLPAGLPVILKVGTFDDSSQFVPQMAIYTVDKQAFHHVPKACLRSNGCQGGGSARRYRSAYGAISSTVGK